MGSSARKKKEKKKDFQKTKLRVGKTKQKADNFTDTSFTSKSIVVNQQSLTTSAPSAVAQFTHYLSLASSSKSESQRRDALSYLTTVITSQPVKSPIPISTAIILPKILPLILDGSSAVRTQLLKLLYTLPGKDIADRVESALLYIRAGLTHLAAEIRNDSLSMLEWLLKNAGPQTVSCPGGWVKTLKAFMSMMGWAVSSGTSKWSSASKATFGKGGGRKEFPRQLLVLAQFLKAGLEDTDLKVAKTRGNCYPLWDVEIHTIPTYSNAYAHLNLFGVLRDEEGEMYNERESRQRIFAIRFLEAVEKGVESGKREGGEIGRAGAILAKVLAEGMAGYNGFGN